MKTWKLLVILLVAAVLVVYYIFGMDVLKQRRQSVSLATQITDMTAVLANIPQAPENPEQRLEEARVKLEAAKAAFAGETNYTRIVDYVMRLADETGIKVVPLSTLPWSAVQVSNVGFSVFNLSLVVTGDFPHLQTYVEQLENGALSTLTVKSLKVVRVSADATANVTADLEIAVYTLAAAAN